MSLCFLSSYDVKDGRVNYDEFAAMMKKGQTEAGANPKKRRDDVFEY